MSHSIVFSQRFSRMRDRIHQLQDRICEGLESVDTVHFHEDRWDRPEGGGGRTRVIQNGKVFEKGGVNVSVVYGIMPAELAKTMQTDPVGYAACGLSLVIHPKSPKVPTTHMNVRYFEMENGRSWFGGGIDLTPYYPHREDFVHFHQVLQQSCNRIIPNSYDSYKNQCDEYFTLKHRQEMRGIGGIFFDYLDGKNKDHDSLVDAVGEAFLPSYLPIVVRRCEEAFTDADKQFQLIRRGRYVEFNLIYDRGTLFGLKTNGRVESILMSLPPQVEFLYDWTPGENTSHAEMMSYYQPHSWI